MKDMQDSILLDEVMLVQLIDSPREPSNKNNKHHIQYLSNLIQKYFFLYKYYEEIEIIFQVRLVYHLYVVSSSLQLKHISYSPFQMQIP